MHEEVKRGRLEKAGGDAEQGTFSNSGGQKSGFFDCLKMVKQARSGRLGRDSMFLLPDHCTAVNGPCQDYEKTNLAVPDVNETCHVSAMSCEHGS